MSINLTLIWSDARTERVRLTITEFEKLIANGREDAEGNRVERVEICPGDILLDPRSQGKGTTE